MRKKALALLLCLAFVLGVSVGCSPEGKKSRVELTQQQREQVQTLVQHREEWAETSESVSVYPVNRIHVSELEDGITFLTVAYVTEGSDTKDDITYFAGVRGFGASGDVFVGVESYHEDWMAGCVRVDLDKLSDQELQDVLEQSYIDFLSK